MTDHLTNEMSDLKKFIIDNNIVGTSAGVCIALAAKDGIQSLVGDVIIPAIVIILRMLHIDMLTKYLPVNGKTEFKITDFIKQMVTFVLIIIISFIFVKFAFGYLLGVNYVKTDTNNNATASAAAVSNASVKKENFMNYFGHM